LDANLSQRRIEPIQNGILHKKDEVLKGKTSEKRVKREKEGET
jgi:hypothetical protein